MKDFTEFTVDNLELLQYALLEEIKKIRPDIFNTDITKRVITVPYTQQTINPVLAQFEESLIFKYGNVMNKTFWITGPRCVTKVHVDGTSKYIPKIKLMFPVLNCQLTRTTWYNYNGEYEFINDNNLEYFFPKDTDNLRASSSISLVTPILARIDKPHGVFNPTKDTRIICSYVFENQDKLVGELV
jgi:hypothetical protein